MITTIINYFVKSDIKMGILANEYKDVLITSNNDYFSALSESIICQQLSEKAGMTIWKRFLALFPKNIITPELVKTKKLEQLRSVGMSYSKAQYIHNIADAFINNYIETSKFPNMSDEEVIQNLSKIKGIGRWTAEMFLIFSLGREDIFSFGDAGLSRAIQKLYGGDRPLTRKQIEKISLRWIPYRSYASLLLWKSLGKG